MAWPRLNPKTHIPGPRRLGRVRHALGASLAAGCLLLFHPHAQGADAAPTSEAKQAAAAAFERGETAYAKGRYGEAGAAFEEAYGHVPHPFALWNAARAYKRAGEAVRAANTFALYLEKAPQDAPDRKNAQTELAQLSKKLGRLQIFAPGAQDIRVDDQPARAGLVYVNPGTHLVSGLAGGQKLTRVQAVDADTTVDVALVAEHATPETPPPAADANEPESPRPKNLRRLPPAVVYGGAGATAIALGLTIGFGVDTLNARDDFDRAPTQEKLDKGRSKQTLTNALLGTTIALGALTGAAAIFFVDWHSDNGRAVKAGLGPSGIVLWGRYE